MRANEVRMIRIRAKELVSSKWPDPFFPLNLQNEPVLLQENLIIFTRVHGGFWGNPTEKLTETGI